MSRIPARAVRTIAVFRALQLGDMLCAIPALRGIRQLFPDARITLIGLPWAHSLKERFTNYLDDFVEFPGHPELPERHADMLEVDRWIRSVRQSAFDLMLQLHGSGSVVNPILAQCQPKSFAAFTTGVSKDIDYPVAYRDDFSEVERLLEMPRSLSSDLFNSSEPQFSSTLEFPILEGEQLTAATLLEQLGVRSAYVCVHPGARDPQRRASAEHFVTALQSRTTPADSIVITGCAAEAQCVSALRAALHDAGVNLPVIDTAQLDLPLGTLAAIIAGSRHLVTNDTGTSHLAAALSVPSTIFFSNSDPARWAPDNRMLHRVIDIRTSAPRLPSVRQHQTPTLQTA